MKKLLAVILLFPVVLSAQQITITPYVNTRWNHGSLRRENLVSFVGVSVGLNSHWALSLQYPAYPTLLDHKPCQYEFGIKYSFNTFKIKL